MNYDGHRKMITRQVSSELQSNGLVSSRAKHQKKQNCSKISGQMAGVKKVSEVSDNVLVLGFLSYDEKSGVDCQTGP